MGASKNPPLLIEKSSLERFCARNHIKQLSLFGSRHKGTALADGRHVDLRTPRDLSRLFRDEVVNNAEVVLRFAHNRRRSDLDTDQMLLFAIVRAIEVLGEAASKVSEEARSAYPHVPWSLITDMRNRLIHGYFDIDADIVWNTASLEIPALLLDLRKTLGSS